MKPPQKREVKPLNINVKRHEVKAFKSSRPSLKDDADEATAVAIAVIKTDEQLRMDRELAKNFQQFEDESDSEYWICLTFQTRQQREAFMRALASRGVMPAQTTVEDKYVSGTALAKSLSIELPPGPQWRDEPEPKARWAALANQHAPEDVKTFQPGLSAEEKAELEYDPTDFD